MSLQVLAASQYVPGQHVMRDALMCFECLVVHLPAVNLQSCSVLHCNTPYILAITLSPVCVQSLPRTTACLLNAVLVAGGL